MGFTWFYRELAWGYTNTYMYIYMETFCDGLICIIE
jgi:hypothetical protein